jgi:hypothetical protein
MARSGHGASKRNDAKLLMASTAMTARAAIASQDSEHGETARRW